MTMLIFSLIVMFTYLVVVGTLLFNYYRPRADDGVDADTARSRSSRTRKPTA